MAPPCFNHNDTKHGTTTDFLTVFEPRFPRTSSDLPRCSSIPGIHPSLQPSQLTQMKKFITTRNFQPNTTQKVPTNKFSESHGRILSYRKESFAVYVCHEQYGVTCPRSAEPIVIVEEVRFAIPCRTCIRYHLRLIGFLQGRATNAPAHTIDTTP